MFLGEQSEQHLLSLTAWTWVSRGWEKLAQCRLCLRGMLVCCRGSRGRQAFVFARFPNNLGMIAFHVFQAIPFLYELRELLDWCAAPWLLVSPHSLCTA